MDLNIDQMKKLIELFEDSELTEISVKQNDYQITLKKDTESGTSTNLKKTDLEKLARSEEGTETEEQETGKVEPETSEGTEAKTKKAELTITSPIVGTFYRSPSPDEPVYFEVGDVVEKGDTVCIIEAMKVMNEVKAEKSGEIVEICVDDGDPVEYGQELFKLRPPEKGS